ncbi:DNA-directed RNA polymerase subunit delta [Paenibacillus urinalis]|uniref:Probable DNA-directed RNA polymerase subunit delta n=1 Tax=Paenibacillus urinalis TaxID=521520 RepID=A0AAX3N2A4_9BACL|nr:DNA-directed RNA polymerase subunit delta [Paenibacillus urinalis]WDH82814.1 DNA-directed RNA polymerase subunit delta [Paenibacillus urinalis]WDH98862.1 DNA-directed RNA polymerase subunit delta [Paenibacillus urinalis]WDI02558.1 DNA-directed RNA polymerase subunit delta [Paenibacillus urinalis]
MSTSLNLKLDPERIREMPMVDLAFMVLKVANTPYYYRDLMNEVAKLRGLGDEEINDVIAQLYTEINIDGRFAYVGTNLWGLKRWYPIDKAEDAVTGTKRPRIINDDDDEDEEYIEEEHEDEDFDHSGDEDEDDDLFDDDSDDDDDDVDDEIIGDEELDEEEDAEDDDDDESDNEDEDEEN